MFSLPHNKNILNDILITAKFLKHADSTIPCRQHIIKITTLTVSNSEQTDKNVLILQRFI